MSGRVDAVRKGSLLRTLVAVLWSFIGLRKGSEYREDLRRLNPLHVIAVGIALAFAFVIGLMVFVRWVVAAH